MIVDDRLETVLRTVAAGPLAARTQLRQLVDLLDRVPASGWSVGHHIALSRLESLKDLLADEDRASLIQAIGLRSPLLVEHFAGDSPKVAIAAICAARLGEGEWLALIPALPVQARGFLRHRRDLGRKVDALLERLGIRDFVLPVPPGADAASGSDQPMVIPLAAPPAVEALELSEIAPDPVPDASAAEGIGAIVRRIEAFRRQRETRLELPDPSAPALPFAEDLRPAAPAAATIDICIDATGAIASAESGFGPMLVGHRPFTDESDAPARCDGATRASARARLPIEGGRIELEGAPAIAGAWRIDAVPDFTPSGHFAGYLARLRRPLPFNGVTAANDDDDRYSSADRLRQLLHELRTPINAIQGFAELIQQQLFGPTPHQYRSLAASIAADAARMLAGFEEVDRLVRLETGHMRDEEGEADAVAVVRKLVAQIEPVVAPREVRLRFTAEEPSLFVAMAEASVERTVWRLLSVIASASAPGERLTISLAGAGTAAQLSLSLPASLAMREDAELFAPDAGGSRNGAMPAPAMLGCGFALRLAAAEIHAAGGSMVRTGPRLVLSMPLLTRPELHHSRV